MPAYFDNGMFAHKPAWHGMGNVLDHWPGTWDEAAQAAGLDWDIETRPVYSFVENQFATGTPVYEKIPGFYQVVRDDTGELFTISRDSRIAISNAEFGQIVKYIMGSDLGRQLKYETLISLKNGRIIAVTMHLDEPYEIPGDPSPYLSYMVGWTCHDVGGMKFGNSQVRVVCANTQQAADADMARRGVAWTIRHTSNWSERVNEARDAVQAALRTNEDWLIMAKDLAHRQVSEADMERFIDRWIPLSTDMSSLQIDRRNHQRAVFRGVYHDSKTTDGIRGTKWGLLQSAIEVCDHFSTFRSEDTRIKRTLLDGDNRKDKALAIVGRL